MSRDMTEVDELIDQAKTHWRAADAIGTHRAVLQQGRRLGRQVPSDHGPLRTVLVVTERRRATRPVDLPEDRRQERQEAYDQWAKSARERGRQIEHNEGCECTTCRLENP